MLDDKLCDTCEGTGIIVVLEETVLGCGGWFSSDGKVYTEDMRACPVCNA